MNRSLRLLTCVSFTCLMAQPAIATATPRNYNIPAQSMAAALQQFALQSGGQIAFAPEIAMGKRSKGVTGTFEADTALSRLLDGSNLAYRHIKGAFVVTMVTEQGSSDPTPIRRQPEAEPTPTNAEFTGLEDIVVTAQKREQNVRDVPIAVSAFTGNQLAARNITDIQNTIGNFAPNVKIVKVARTTSAQIAIRGAVTGNPALY